MVDPGECGKRLRTGVHGFLAPFKGGASRSWDSSDLRPRAAARKVIEIDLKLPTRPPAFAFVEFDSSRAAEDACAGRDGYDFHGDRLRVRARAAALAGVYRTRVKGQGRAQARLPRR